MKVMKNVNRINLTREVNFEYRQFGPVENQQMMQERGWTLSSVVGNNNMFPNEGGQGKFMKIQPYPNAELNTPRQCGNCRKNV